MEHQGIHKNSRSRVENQQQFQPRHDALSENQTRDTLGDERFHQCTIATPQKFKTFIGCIAKRENPRGKVIY